MRRLVSARLTMSHMPTAESSSSRRRRMSSSSLMRLVVAAIVDELESRFDLAWVWNQDRGRRVLKELQLQRQIKFGGRAACLICGEAGGTRVSGTTGDDEIRIKGGRVCWLRAIEIWKGLCKKDDSENRLRDATDLKVVSACKLSKLDKSSSRR